MPGKVNPTQCEGPAMWVGKVTLNDIAVSVGDASGNFELNVYKPLIVYNCLQRVRLLADGMISFEAHCLCGIEARQESLADLLDQSLMLVTALTQDIG
jgi:fumarate hydratase class II